jgi:hypothetical protein
VTPHNWCRVTPFGHPGITARLTAPPGLSRPPTSFIGSWCQGIHTSALTHLTKTIKMLASTIQFSTHNHTPPQPTPNQDRPQQQPETHTPPRQTRQHACSLKTRQGIRTSTKNTTWQTPQRRPQGLPRKEVIQPHLPVRLPCYDFVPIASPTFDHSLPKRVRPWASGVADFRDVTGGVYKARERIHRSVADLRLLATPTSRGRVADPDPN